MGFSRYKNEKMNFITARMQNNDVEYRRKAAVALRQLRPSKRLIRAFDELAGDNADWVDVRSALASNGRARTTLRKRVVRTIKRLCERQPELEFIFGSIIHEPWATTSDNTHLDLADMQQRTRNVINMCGFKGAIMMMEFQAEPGDRRTNSWPIHPNVHFIAWVDPGFNKRAVGKRVRQSRRLTPFENAKTLKLSEKMKAGPDLWRRCSYLIKEPFSAKKRHKVTGRFEKTIQGMHAAACLRMTEVLSHIRLRELLLLTGEATSLRRNLLRPRPAGVGYREPSSVSTVLPARLWDNIRATDPHFYEPLLIKRIARCGRR
jgi:hypothetical protein